jgi:hypothetical protein
MYRLRLTDVADDNDVLAYSAVNTKDDDDSTVFSSGGAIMEALAE